MIYVGMDDTSSLDVRNLDDEYQKDPNLKIGDVIYLSRELKVKIEDDQMVLKQTAHSFGHCAWSES